MMKMVASIAVLLLATAALTFTYAQEGDGSPDGNPPPRRPGDGPPHDRRPGPPPPDPFMLLFDTDQDEQISAEEIDAAAAVLRKLDADGDGVLTRHELPRPPRPDDGEVGGNHRPGPPPPRDGRRPDDRRDRGEPKDHQRPAPDCDGGSKTTST